MLELPDFTCWPLQKWILNPHDDIYSSQDLVLCGPCIEDVKIVGNSLVVVNRWDGKITVQVTAEWPLGVLDYHLEDVKQELENGDASAVFADMGSPDQSKIDEDR